MYQICVAFDGFIWQDQKVDRGIAITITRLVERRERRADEVGVCIHTGRRLTRVDSLPDSPSLASHYGSEPSLIETRIEFLPPDVIPMDGLRYRKQVLPKLRAMGLIRSAPANSTIKPRDHVPSDDTDLVAC